MSEHSSVNPEQHPQIKHTYKARFKFVEFIFGEDTNPKQQNRLSELTSGWDLVRFKNLDIPAQPTTYVDFVQLAVPSKNYGQHVFERALLEVLGILEVLEINQTFFDAELSTRATNQKEWSTAPMLKEAQYLIDDINNISPEMFE